jgi:molybdopterin-guanine dinucleotide biosynthesis protein
MGSLQTPPLPSHRIVVAGLRSGIGKTLLAEQIVSLVPGIAAIKVTIHDGATSITTAPDAIMVEGKDTWRLRQSGAYPVVWVQTTEQDIADSIQQALSLLCGVTKILIEGNSVVQYVDPTVVFFVSDSSILTQPIKPSRLHALQKATVVINNLRAPLQQDNAAVVAFCKKVNPHAPVHSLALTDTSATRLLLRQVLEQKGLL